MAEPRLDFTNYTSHDGKKLPEPLALVSQLRQKVVGQDIAIEELVRVVLTKLVSQNSKPLMILLPGPDTFAKCDMSKALAEALEAERVRIDMRNYREYYTFSELLGRSIAYVGSNEDGVLPNVIRRSKNRLVLLFTDVERAHMLLWPRLLTFFDEETPSDILRRLVVSKDTICLFTSNLSTEEVLKNRDSEEEISLSSEYFPPELLNRIERIIPFAELQAGDITQLTFKQLMELKVKRTADRCWGLTLNVEQEALETLLSAVFQESERFRSNEFEKRIKELLVDDFIDLARARVREVRLVLRDNHLRMEADT